MYLSNLDLQSTDIHEVKTYKPLLMIEFGAIKEDKLYFTRFTTLLWQGLVHLVLSLHCLGVFKYLNQCHCTGWRYLNIHISVTALAGGI